MSSRLIISSLFRTRHILLPHAVRLIQKTPIRPQTVIPIFSPTQTRFLASWGPDLPPVDPKEVQVRVFKSLATHDKIDPNQLKMECHLANDLGLDSLDQVEILVAVEDEFDIDIEDVDAERIFTVQDLVSHVVKTLESKPDRRQNPGPRYDPNLEFGKQ